MPDELQNELSRLGWTLISERTTASGLVLYKMGRNPETGALGFRGFEETDERSADGWQIALEPQRVPLGWVVQERMRL